MAAMQKYESLLHAILPQVLPCPKSMALDAIQMIAMDFCRETGIWAVVAQERIGACDLEICLALPQGACLSSVSRVELDGEQVDIARFGAREVGLKACPGRECVAVVCASLRPLRTALAMPEDLLEEYGDYIVFGVIAKLKAMSGQKIEWSDPQGAATNYQLYQEGKAQAKARKFRKRSETNILYVNTGEGD